MTKREIETDEKAIDTILYAIQTCPLRVVTGDWGVGLVDGKFAATTQVCPMGALLLGTEYDEFFYRAAGRLLGVSAAWVDGFVIGFDTGTAAGGSHQFARGSEVGAIIREMKDEGAFQ